MSPAPRDPWRDAPTSELGDQVLPRWFVLLGAAAVLAALGAVVAAFLVFGPDEVPAAARRPPPAGGYAHDVGDLNVGASEPVALDPVPCPELAGLRVAGSEADRAALAEGLAPLCDRPELVAPFAAAGGVVRFAQFENTGVDSTASLDQPLILLNNRYAVTDPAQIAPLVVHDLVVRAGDPAAAQTALDARAAEAEACAELTIDSPGCRAAAAVLALDDPLAALREAGYR